MTLMLLSLLLVVFSLTTGEFVIVGILPSISEDLSVSIPTAGLLVTAYAVGMIVGGPVVTTATARISRKALMISLIAVSIVGNLSSAIAPNYSILVVSRFVAGLVVATFFAVAITTALSMASAGKQASTIAKLTLGLNLGIILGAPIGTFIGQHLGWRATFAAVAAISFVALLLVIRFVPSQPQPHQTGSVLSELRVFTSRNVQLAIVLTVLGNIGILMVFTYIASLLTEISGFSATMIPVLLLVYGGGAVIGNFLGGWLSDKALMPSLIGLLTVSIGTLALFWLVSPIQIAAVFLTFAIGVLAFAVVPGMQTRVVSTASAAPTLAVAVNASGYQIAAAFAGWLGGRVIDGGLGLRSVYLVGALLTVAGLLTAFYSMRQDQRTALAVPNGAAIKG